MLENDHEKGIVTLIIVFVIFLYYTVWLIGLPFFEDTILLNFFLSHNIALLCPAVAGLVFIGSLFVFTIYHLNSNSKTPKLE